MDSKLTLQKIAEESQRIVNLKLDTTEIEERDIPIPTNLTKLQVFLEFANYNHMYVSNMHESIAPLNALLKKDAKWIWKVQDKKYSWKYYTILLTYLGHKKFLNHGSMKKGKEL